MAKTLEFTIKSPRQIKQGDTETTFTFICKNDGSVVDLTQATSITAKIGNSSGYLKSQPIATTSLAGLNKGWFNLQPMPTLISGLPAGDYQLEVWVVDPAGTSIYPSDNPLGFTITNNIESESGASITTIAFDDFVEAMNKAASTIAKGDKGDKGDTGTVDNTGLINAPAFQSLQTQVNDSAVGTNLYTDTKNLDNLTLWYASSLWTKTTDTYKGLAVMQGTQDWNGLSQYTQVKKGDILTYSVYAKNISGTGTSSISWPLSDQTEGSYSTATTNIYGTSVTITDSWQRLSGTVVATSDGYLRPRIERTTYNTNTLQIAGIKVEKGSVATDWCPNPSEILTQSDYAKMQAAIVALGGSLK
ncbi:collagen-like protein [Lactiplantibacillus plantarum]|uniref:collagen-like protein n=1 Tax=Lactiplantibacillus plantarum TaxID=1590 RepID=UPI00230755B3|nr:collagen-like protein [Lactiplantibacillus plantarum]WCE42606.1 collagen-like protein [Lactiplantibacillus plantarum]